jgi:hypothetical protein
MVTDFALSEAAGDWSVIAIIAIDPDGKIFLRNIWRERVTGSTIRANTYMQAVASQHVGLRERSNHAEHVAAHPAAPATTPGQPLASACRQASEVQKAGALKASEGAAFICRLTPWADALIAGNHRLPRVSTMIRSMRWRTWAARGSSCAEGNQDDPKPQGMCLT